jgi:hypothetical protein
LSKKRHFFAKFFGENIYKIITSVPVRDSWRAGLKVSNRLTPMLYYIQHRPSYASIFF